MNWFAKLWEQHILLLSLQQPIFIKGLHVEQIDMYIYLDTTIDDESRFKNHCNNRV